MRLSRNFPPKEPWSLSQARQEVEGVAQWAKRSGYVNITERLEWAVRVLAQLEADSQKTPTDASACGVTFPPDTLPRVAGAETIVVCPLCKTEWKFDDHDNCPTCRLAPQGVN